MTIAIKSVLSKARDAIAKLNLSCVPDEDMDEFITDFIAYCQRLELTNDTKILNSITEDRAMADGSTVRTELRLFVIGEVSGNPEDWMWGDRTIVVAHNAEEAAALVDGHGPATEVCTTEPMVICTVQQSTPDF